VKRLIFLGGTLLWAALPASDDFNRADEATLGAPWVTVGQGIELIGNAVRGSGGADNCSRYDDAAWQADHYSQLTALTAGGEWIGVAVRIQTGSTSYYDCVCSGSSCFLRRNDNGSVTNLASGSSVVDGDVIRLEVTGSDLSCKKNAVGILSAADSTYATGQGGIAAYNSGTSRGDDWSGGNLGAAGAAKRRVVTE
jgi:hypothetical protein